MMFSRWRHFRQVAIEQEFLARQNTNKLVINDSITTDEDAVSEDSPRENPSNLNIA